MYLVFCDQIQEFIPVMALSLQSYDHRVWTSMDHKALPYFPQQFTCSHSSMQLRFIYLYLVSNDIHYYNYKCTPNGNISYMPSEEACFFKPSTTAQILH